MSTFGEQVVAGMATDEHGEDFIQQLADFAEMKEQEGETGADEVEDEQPEGTPLVDIPELVEEDSDPEPEASTQEGEGEGEQGSASGSPSPDTDFSLDQFYRDMYGEEPTAEQAVGLMRIAEDLARLTPEQSQQLYDTLYGGGTPQTPAPAPAPAPEPTVTNLDLPDYLDDETKQAFQTMQAANERLQEQMKAIELQQQSANHQQQQQQVQMDVSNGVKRFRDDYPQLNDQDYAVLQAKAGQSAIYAGLASQNGHERATYDTLRYTLADMPELRQRIIQEDVAKEEARTQEDAKRKAKASAVSGGSAGTPQPDNKPKTKQDRAAAMLADIKAGMADGDLDFLGGGSE